MWLTLLPLAFGAYTIYSLARILIGWRRNIKLAKASGLPYIVTPVWHLDIWWMILAPLGARKLLSRLPTAWTEPWLDAIAPLYSWRKRFSRFENLECAMLMLVSPKYNYLYVADADAIADIVQRRNDFPKPTQYYRLLDIYGKNIVSTEGDEWRYHRRIVAPAFSEQNNHLVWDESRDLAELMVADWTRKSGSSVRTVAQDAMRLSLYVISKAGFGRKMEWPSVDDEAKEAPDAEAVESHRLSYQFALGSLVKNTPLIVALPKLVLRHAPFYTFKLAYQAYNSWSGYMSEMYDQKYQDLASGVSSEGMDLMAALIRGNTGGNKQAAQTLSRPEIMGNSFVLIVAGHETTANSIHFSLICLAMNVRAQRKVQAELDEIFGDRPTSKWSYEDDLPHLFGGMLGACLAELLRVIPSVVEVPKWTEAPQPLTVGGKQYIVPKHTYVSLSAASVHRNPRFWPHGPPTDPEDPEHPLSNRDNDLEEFKPERWLPADYGPSSPRALDGKGFGGADRDRVASDSQDLGINSASDTAASLYKPVKGSYLPFSIGPRSCIGRRFAQVEYFAVLAVILKSWSVELAVDDFASDEEVSRMDTQQKREVWSKARHQARDTFNDKMRSRISLQLRTGVSIPLRFVPRGQERFDGIRA